MGGANYLITGKRIRDPLLEPRRRPRWKPFGRAPPAARPQEDVQLDGTRLILYPEDAFRWLTREIDVAIKHRIAQPWPSTRQVFDYLALDVMSATLCGEVPPRAEPKWFISIRLIGCAGMADVSAAVVWHWIDRWFHELDRCDRDRIAATFGLETSEPVVTNDRPRFIPIGSHGYARFQSSGPDEYWEPEAGPGWFELDGSVVESADETQLQQLRKLDEVWRNVMQTGRCFCQWCEPHWDPRSSPP